jgi:hypothetical protein
METVKMMTTAFGEQTMGRRQLFEWFSKFKALQTLLKILKSWDIHQCANHIGIWDY